MVFVENATRFIDVNRLSVPLEALSVRIAGTNRASAQIQTGTTIEKTSRVGILRELLRVFNRKLKAKFFAEIILLTLILIVGLEVRLHYATFLDPFEDGYQNWWISANLVQTGQYWDRHSMMTQGNWLPLYHFFSAGVLELAGLRSMEGLKVANIVLSTATALTVYSICRKRGPLVALTATAFFSLNFIDIVVSGWATAESLTSLLVLLGYATLFQFNRPQTGRYWIAAVALALAVVTRYEAWMITSLLVAFLALSRIEKEKRQLMIIATLPAIAAMLAYFAYSIQWGFLPSIVVNQTSTDIRYQLSAGTQPSPTDLLFRFWSGYLGFFPLVLLFGGTYSILRFRREFGTWIVLSLWGFVMVYTVSQFGNPSFRYVLITVPLLSIFGAFALADALRGLGRLTRESPIGGPSKTLTLTLIGTVLMVGTLLPSSVSFWAPGFPASLAMEPLEHAGEYLMSLPLPDGKILVSESPIAAYFSGYPPDRILGSRWLPDNRSAALTFLKATAAYIVYVGVPYYKLRQLFPVLQDGTTTLDFKLLYDAGGIQAGTHAVFVYGVTP